MLKSFEDIVPAIRRRFEKTWADGVCDPCLDAWPHAFALGRPTQAELARSALQLVSEIDELRIACDRYGCLLETEPRRMGAVQEIPVRIVVPTANVAAEILGRGELAQLDRARTRAGVLRKEFPWLAVEDLRTIVRRIDAWSDVDTELLIAAGLWFGEHDARGMTPRQVPLEGFHAKWLDGAGRRALVCLLAGKSDLGLVDRPHELSLAYLDPAYVRAGGRRYDSCVEGDAWQIAYVPQLVVVVENKDSYLWFPQVEGGVCVFGSGRLGTAVCSKQDWIVRAPRLYYWGDMDADGLEILDAYRSVGLPARSILMDVAAFDRYERFGTRLAAGKRSLERHVRKETPWLEPGEQQLYDRLCDPTWQGALRIEQERIPLDAVVRELGI